MASTENPDQVPIMVKWLWWTALVMENKLLEDLEKELEFWRQKVSTICGKNK